MRTQHTLLRHRFDPATFILARIAPELLLDDESDLEVELENLQRQRKELTKKRARLLFWSPSDESSDAAYDHWMRRLEGITWQIEELDEEIFALEQELYA